MATGGEVALRISADTSDLTKAVRGSIGLFQDLERVVSKSFGSFGSGLSVMGGAASAALAVGAAITASVKAAADYGDQLDNMSQRTGVAVEELSRLQYAAKLSDTSTEALGKGIGNLSKLMVGAAAGGAESGKLFERFGISLRNADGTMRSTTEVLYDLADVFSVMPAGPEKTALAMDFFGKKLGTELIPLLNNGSAGLKAMSDEAERLGLVLSAEKARAAAEFNDQLDRMNASSKSAQVSIGMHLVPTLNKYLDKLNEANKAGLGFWDRLAIGMRDAALVGEKSPAETIQKLKLGIEGARKEIEGLEQARNKIESDPRIDGFGAAGKRTEINSVNAQIAGLEAEIAAKAQQVQYYEAQNKRITGDDQDTANKRLNIAAQLARETANLEQLKAIAAGKASADILKTDKARTDEQLKDAEKLRGALQTAWETSRKEAQKAADDAQKLLEKAAGVRTSAADKATDLRNADLPEEDKKALALTQAKDLQSEGNYYAAAAGAAKLDGRTKDFEKYQKQAESFLDRAMKFAEAAGNADSIEAIGNAQAGVIENNAKAKQGEATALEAQASAQAATLATLDVDIEALKAKAANIEIKANITQAEGAVAALQKQMAELNDKTVTVTMRTVAADVNSAGMGGFADGGLLRGPGTATSDSILARLSNGEFIVKAAAVNHYGPGLLSLINAMKLPKFADGGEVGNSAIGRLEVPSVSSQPRTSGGASDRAPLVLDFGKLGRYQTEATVDVAEELTKVIQRAALSHGRRR